MASNILKISGPVQGFRRLVSTATPSAQGHAGGGTFWKKLSLLIALPGVALCYVNAEIKEKEHHDHPRPEFKAYQHLRLRTKPYPWGDGNRTLFHNKALNPLPEGYED